MGSVRACTILLNNLSIIKMRFEFIYPEQVLATDSFRFVERFLTKTRRWNIGWHYVTDLAWIVSKARSWPKNAKILDAGGGAGPTQFLLAEMGFDVTNIDLSLPSASRPYISRYGLTRTQLDSYVPTEYVEHLRGFGSMPLSLARLKQVAKKSGAAEFVWGELYVKRHERWRGEQIDLAGRPIGTLRWIVGNLCACPEVPSEAYDAVVSLSALEHIPTELLPAAVAEIRRISKPNANWAVTTSGTNRSSSWFHEPSKGWCFSEKDLAGIFGAMPTAGQVSADAALEAYRNCGYLKAHMASFYRRSGNNGMPWGKWDPQYVPVGIYC